ncbi:MAG: Glu/Leu/Phe/Val dehydrogenase family protein, partial [Gemmatimonadales bacterium]
LRGRYITAEDVGTSPSDMEYVREETDYVVGLKGGSGDPSPVTAFGVYRGILACLQFRYGSDDPSGKTVALQGLGHVGYNVCRHLHEGGAELVVTDIDDGRVKRVVDEFGARGVKPEEIYEVDAQVFAPCALGGVINDKSLEVLKVEIVAGAANNQLAEDRHGDALYERDVIYAPDYVINGGGLISVNGELEGWETDRVNEKTSEIYDTVLQLLEISRHEGVPTYQAARRLAERRIAAGAERSAQPA